MAERLFKVLGDGGQCIYGTGSWPLPVGDEPGERLVVEGKLAPCANGLHLCRAGDLIHWLGAEIYEAETFSGERIDDDNKIVVREARLVRRIETWNESTARLFAADCAERVLPIFERERPNDNRPRKAIEVARAVARGTADMAALRSAWDAADAAGTPAAARAAAAAVRDAADATWAAAAAVRDAGGAEAAERKWQTTRLFQYLNGEIK